MNRVEKCEETFRELFGGAPVVNEGNDPEFMRILQRFIFGDVCAVGSLDNRMRELITITVLTVNQTLPQLKAHTAACLRVGLTPVEIREAIYQCAPFIGFPKTLNAIGVMNEVFEEQGIALPLESQETVTEETRYELGKQIQDPIYGSEIADRYAYLPQEYAQAIPRFLTEFGFGDYMTRTGMDGKTRELLILVLLAALGGADLQVYSHGMGAMKAGNSVDEILCALMHGMPYMGFPRFLNALNAIRPLLEQKTQA